MHEVIKFYKSNIYFYIEYDDKYTRCKSIIAGMLQGGAFGLIEYLIYTTQYKIDENQNDAVKKLITLTKRGVGRVQEMEDR